MRLSFYFALFITVLGGSLVLRRETLPPIEPGAPLYQVGHCVPGQVAHERDVLQALMTSSPRCTEEIARLLRSRATDSTIQVLFEISESGSHSLARRNALRVLGRFAQAPARLAVRQSLRERYAAEFYGLLLRRLQHETHADPLHDTIWILDTVYYPAFSARSYFKAISLNTSYDPLLRERAIAAFDRLAYLRPDPGTDLDFAIQALRADLPGVRAYAAGICSRIAARSNDAALRADLLAELQAAYAAELSERSTAAPVAVPPSHLRPDQFDQPAGRLVASVAIATALDRLDGGERRALRRSHFRAHQLATRIAADGIMIQSGLPANELEPILERSRLVKTAFFELLGPEFREPLPDEANGEVTVLLFADRSSYRDYMAAFIGFGDKLDGIYIEDRATLYTYQRSRRESANPVEATVQHEMTHFLTGRYLFPGSWNSEGYHKQPRGWFDEGLAEVMAGLEPGQGWQDPATQHPDRLAEICRRRQLPQLAILLRERAGYDQFGRFPYADAWALNIYLINEHPAAFQRIARAFRDEQYRVQHFADYVERASLADFEQEWHQAIRDWCAQADMVQ